MNNNIDITKTISLTINDARAKLILVINNVDLPIPIIEGILNGIMVDLKNQELIQLRNEIVREVQEEIANDYIAKSEIEQMKKDGRLVEVDDVSVEPFNEDNGDITKNEGVADGTKAKKTK